MGEQLSILRLIVQASVPVQFVIAILLLASLSSWAIIFGKSRVIGRVRREADRFEARFVCYQGRRQRVPPRGVHDLRHERHIRDCVGAEGAEFQLVAVEDWVRGALCHRRIFCQSFGGSHSSNPAAGDIGCRKKKGRG